MAVELVVFWLLLHLRLLLWVWYLGGGCQAVVTITMVICCVLVLGYTFLCW